jgi:hypothetical protein
MSLTLRHYSYEPLPAVLSVPQREREYQLSYSKPCGFWVSVVGEDDWASWCKSESYRDTENQFATDVILDLSANVLVMRSHLELDGFTSQFGEETRYRDYAINWSAVAKAYQGIIIAPYIRSARMSLNWYYPWDCASGCIWDANAIARLEAAPIPAELAA